MLDGQMMGTLPRRDLGRGFEKPQGMMVCVCTYYEVNLAV